VSNIPFILLAASNEAALIMRLYGASDDIPTKLTTEPNGQSANDLEATIGILSPKIAFTTKHP
jgi:hypothetical protein